MCDISLRQLEFAMKLCKWPHLRLRRRLRRLVDMTAFDSKDRQMLRIPDGLLI